MDPAGVMTTDHRSRSAARPPARGDAAARALHGVARAFRRVDAADAVWLAVRESRSRTAVIRCVDGADSPSGSELRIEPGVGVGGMILAGGAPWKGLVRPESGGLTPVEHQFLVEAGVAHALIVPLRGRASWSREPRLDGVVYLGRREDRPFDHEAVAQAVALGERLARPARDAQRLDDAMRRWGDLRAQLADAPPDHRLDTVAQAIATDTRVALRSIIALVFRLDRSSGALHALGVDGVTIPVVRRGQVLPPGCGAAGQAIAARAPYIAANYTASQVRLPPILADAASMFAAFTTLSVPLIVGDDVIGAITVSRGTEAPYEADEVRLAEQLAGEAAEVLTRAQQESDDARRQHGATELSRLAGSLTHSLSVAAVCDRLVYAVVRLVHGVDATVWDPDGRLTGSDTGSPGSLGKSNLRDLRHVVDRVLLTDEPFWTPDLTNDPRLMGSPGWIPDGPAAGACAVLAVPVRARETRLGILVVRGKSGRAFTDADRDLAQALADQAALAIENARAFHDLEVSKAALLCHEKLVATGRLAAGLAHELRNPLQNALGFVAELYERAQDSAFQELPQLTRFPSFLGHARAELHRAASIVDRLLDYVRERKPSLETVDLRQIVAQAIDLVAPRAAETHTPVRVASPDAPLRVQGDPVMLRQVVVNMLTNALDALEGPGEVFVDLRRAPTGRAVVTVRDTGRGIAPADLPRVFDLFYTTKDVGKGLGLGLAVCQTMIEQHGGTITITSPGPGHGATVFFELPAEP
jgi:signal transduction histidine kinase